MSDDTYPQHDGHRDPHAAHPGQSSDSNHRPELRDAERAIQHAHFTVKWLAADVKRLPLASARQAERFEELVQARNQLRQLEHERLAERRRDYYGLSKAEQGRLVARQLARNGQYWDEIKKTLGPSEAVYQADHFWQATDNSGQRWRFDQRTGIAVPLKGEGKRPPHEGRDDRDRRRGPPPQTGQRGARRGARRWPRSPTDRPDGGGQAQQLPDPAREHARQFTPQRRKPILLRPTVPHEPRLAEQPRMDHRTEALLAIARERSRKQTEGRQQISQTRHQAPPMPDLAADQAAQSRAIMRDIATRSTPKERQEALDRFMQLGDAALERELARQELAQKRQQQHPGLVPSSARREKYMERHPDVYGKALEPRSVPSAQVKEQHVRAPASGSRGPIGPASGGSQHTALTSPAPTQLPTPRQERGPDR